MLINHNCVTEYKSLLDRYMVPAFRRSCLSQFSPNMMPYTLVYRYQGLGGTVCIFSEAVEDGCIQIPWKIVSFASIYKTSRPRIREFALITAWNADLIKTKTKLCLWGFDGPWKCGCFEGTCAHCDAALSAPVSVACTATSDVVHHFISLWQSNISLV
jgi:hypothetical protein